jgi:hypothetical protein
VTSNSREGTTAKKAQRTGCAYWRRIYGMHCRKTGTAEARACYPLLKPAVKPFFRPEHTHMAFAGGALRSFMPFAWAGQLTVNTHCHLGRFQAKAGSPYAPATAKFLDKTKQKTRAVCAEAAPHSSYGRCRYRSRTTLQHSLQTARGCAAPRKPRPAGGPPWF